MPLVLVIERRKSDQPMDARLSLEVAVYIWPIDLKIDTLDAGLIAVHPVKDSRPMAARLAPPPEHCDQHLRPILGINAARSGLERYDCGARVMRPAQHRVYLKCLKRFFNICELGLKLRLQFRRVFREGHFSEFHQPARAPFDGLPLGNLLTERRRLSQDALRALSVIPEVGLRRLCVQAGDTGFLAGQIKDAPGTS